MRYKTKTKSKDISYTQEYIRTHKRQKTYRGKIDNIDKAYNRPNKIHVVNDE